MTEELSVELNANSWTYPDLGIAVITCWIGNDDTDPDVLVKEMD